MTDEIFLEGVRLYGFHGVHAEEQKLGQRFIVDLRVACDLSEAGQSDRLEATVSYSALYRVIKEIVEGPPKNLIESVAEAIADRVLAEFPRVESAVVTVRKPEAPVRGAVFDAAGVTVRRRRDAS
ncbi:MAG TPA: dihydroneopterin aldolase [Thermomicrobiales bacterium]